MFALLFTTLHAMMWVDNAGPHRSLPLVPIGPQWYDIVPTWEIVDWIFTFILLCSVCAMILEIQPTNRDRS